MNGARDVTFAPAVELARLYRTRRASPLEVMQALLARVDAVNPNVNAIVTLAREAALWEARRATAGLKRNTTLWNQGYAALAARFQAAGLGSEG